MKICCVGLISRVGLVLFVVMVFFLDVLVVCLVGCDVKICFDLRLEIINFVCKVKNGNVLSFCG